ncbi:MULTISPECIES: MobQ family relaxase [unclassified Shinella]|uniref:MobQ family relaxase n=1 Tax=unclassified Shinella TaxID=2643062 RepID=UPI00068327EB|nr:MULTISPECIES: MobQ family relaxase [unclassified Shinella]
MAIYHFSGQILGRKPKVVNGALRPGSKAVAAAAYRAGEKLRDHGKDQTHDYSNRRGVVYSEILTPPGSAPWLTDRETLWNTVEALETRKDAQLAREFNMALPHELSQEDRIELVRDFVEKQFVARGMVADLALHDPVKDSGSAKNYHAHVMLTLRRATREGLDPVKTREWNSKELLQVWRAEWAVACNRALERAGKKVRVDHRTLEAQRDWARSIGDMVAAERLARKPETHVGPKARRVAQRTQRPRSEVRMTGPYRKPKGATTSARRQRNYPATDQGSRLSWLEQVLVGNDKKLKQDLININRRCDRLRRKMDYWERRITFKLEGLHGGKKFRFDRWKAAEEEKARKAEAARIEAHARKRREQLQGMLRMLEQIIAGKARTREDGLVRQREVEGWLREAGRDWRERDGRERGGRERKPK